MSTNLRIRFAAAYRRCVDEVLRYLTPAMQQELARHNVGWATGATDFGEYLRRSEPRFFRAYQVLAARPGAASLCDIGGFWGVFPMTLKELGVQEVTMTEALGYYSSAFDGLFEAIRARGVRIVDFDPFDAASPTPGQYDVITVMAVLEHYPHSLASFMGQMLRMLKPAGRLYIEVPNIAYWPKRLQLLRGRSPLVSVEAIYRSAVPFIGHHHEYTLPELRGLAQLAGLRVIAVDAFNCSVDWSFRYALSNPLFAFMSWFKKDSREVISAEMMPVAQDVSLRPTDPEPLQTSHAGIHGS